MSLPAFGIETSTWADLATWRELGPTVAAAAAVGLAGGVLARRAGATALAVVASGAVVALTLAWVSEPGGTRVVASHLLIVLALLLTVRPRTGPAEAALGLAVALAAAVLDPGAWLLVPAVPAAALSGGDARQRRFVGSALLAVALPAVALAAVLWTTGRWSPPWPPADVTGLVSVLALPGLVATLAAAVAAGLSAAVRVAQRRQSVASGAATGSPVAVLGSALVVVSLAAALLGGVGSERVGAVGSTATAPGSQAGGEPLVEPPGDTASTPSLTGGGTSGASGASGSGGPGGDGDAVTGTPGGESATPPPEPSSQCPPPMAPAPGATADPALLAAAAELRRNGNITLCQAGAAALDAGQVDGRLLAVLALLADGHTFRVEEIAGGAARLAVLDSVTGSDAPAADAAIWLRAQRGPYAPTTVEVVGRNGLSIAYGEMPDA